MIKLLKTCLLPILISIPVVSTSLAVLADEPAAWSWEERWQTEMTIGADGRVIAAVATGLPYREGMVVAFSLDDPAKVQELYRHESATWAIASSPDRQAIASSDYKGNLMVAPASRLTDAQAEVKRFEKAFEGWTRAISFSPDGQQIVAGNEAGNLFIWSLAEGKVVNKKELASGQIMSLTFSPSGSRLAVATGSGKLQLLNWPDLASIKEVVVGDQSLWSVVFAGDDEHLWVGGADRRVVRVTAAGEMTEVGKLNDWVTCIRSLPGGGMLALSMQGQIKHASSAASTELAEWGAAPRGAWSLLLPDKERMVVAMRRGGPAVLKSVVRLTYADGKAVEQ